MKNQEKKKKQLFNTLLFLKNQYLKASQPPTPTLHNHLLSSSLTLNPPKSNLACSVSHGKPWTQESHS
jgi:hypothetical protein